MLGCCAGRTLFNAKAIYLRYDETWTADETPQGDPGSSSAALAKLRELLDGFDGVPWGKVYSYWVVENLDGTLQMLYDVIEDFEAGSGWGSPATLPVPLAYYTAAPILPGPALSQRSNHLSILALRSPERICRVRIEVLGKPSAYGGGQFAGLTGINLQAGYADRGAYGGIVGCERVDLTGQAEVVGRMPAYQTQEDAWPWREDWARYHPGIAWPGDAGRLTCCGADAP